MFHACGRTNLWSLQASMDWLHQCPVDAGVHTCLLILSLKKAPSLKPIVAGTRNLSTQTSSLSPLILSCFPSRNTCPICSLCRLARLLRGTQIWTAWKTTPLLACLAGHKLISGSSSHPCAMRWTLLTQHPMIGRYLTRFVCGIVAPFWVAAGLQSGWGRAIAVALVTQDCWTAGHDCKACSVAPSQLLCAYCTACMGKAAC